MIKMNTSAHWILANAEKEGNGIVSVGGLLCALKKAEQESQGRLALRTVEVSQAIKDKQEGQESHSRLEPAAATQSELDVLAD